MRSFRLLLLCLCLLSTSLRAEVVPLPGFNIDIRQTSVSGLSSGAFMAVQFDVAYSAMLKGVGAMAGGPYFCARNSLQAAQGECMAASSPIDVNNLIRITDRNAASGAIDPTSNLATQRVWLFSGTQDAVVRQEVENSLQKYYQHYAGSANIAYKKDLAAGHAVPTDFFGNTCATTGDPFINNCAYDGAGELLKWIYGSLKLPAAESLTGSFVEFDQRQFIADPNSHSMANSGWLYVPESCRQGAACRLHIVFHGCKQYPGYLYFSGAGMTHFGRTFVDNAGYNRWADTNHIVVLYPQTTNGSGNPNGCWDWWGYDDVNYAQKNGHQMAAVKAMADRVASPVLPAPQNASADQISDGSVALTWHAVNGAAGYYAYRNGIRATANPVSDTRLIDTGLAPGTRYDYLIRAIDAAGREGSASGIVSVSTTGAAPTVAPPTALHAGTISATTVALAWTAAPDVAGYNVLYRNAAAGHQYAKANGHPITGIAYKVGGLDSGMTYQFVVQSQNSAGTPSANSNEISATTPAAAACFTASNFAHVVAGRAHASLALAFANGSNALMGFNNIFMVTALKQTGPNFYVVDNLTCP